MRKLPLRQQSAEVGVAQSLLFASIAVLVQRQGLVIDKTTRPSETSQMAKLFAVGHDLESVALPSEHPRRPFPSTGGLHVCSPLVRPLSTPQPISQPSPAQPSPAQPNPSPQATRPTRRCGMENHRAATPSDSEHGSPSFGPTSSRSLCR